MSIDTLHVFYADDSEEFWVARDLADLRDVIDEEQGHGSFFDNYGGPDAFDEWTQLDDARPKAILFTAQARQDGGGTLTPDLMASEDDDPDGCIEVTKTWGEWAAWHGRGFFGGGRQ